MHIVDTTAFLQKYAVYVDHEGYFCDYFYQRILVDGKPVHINDKEAGETLPVSDENGRITYI